MIDSKFLFFTTIINKREERKKETAFLPFHILKVITFKSLKGNVPKGNKKEKEKKMAGVLKELLELLEERLIEHDESRKRCKPSYWKCASR